MASENKGAFADQQFQCTKKAHEFYHALGTPSTSDFIAIICMNVIEIILSHDMENIFGTDIDILKEKNLPETHSCCLGLY